MSRKTVALLLFSDIIEIMLEKFSKKDKKNYFDAHFHYAVCLEKGISIPDFENDIKWQGISCAHSIQEFESSFKYYTSLWNASSECRKRKYKRVS